jgi:hypothetical protein
LVVVHAEICFAFLEALFDRPAHLSRLSDIHG